MKSNIPLLTQPDSQALCHAAHVVWPTSHIPRQISITFKSWLPKSIEIQCSPLHTTRFSGLLPCSSCSMTHLTCSWSEVHQFLDTSGQVMIGAKWLERFYIRYLRQSWIIPMMRREAPAYLPLTPFLTNGAWFMSYVLSQVNYWCLLIRDVSRLGTDCNARHWKLKNPKPHRRRACRRLERHLWH